MNENEGTEDTNQEGNEESQPEGKDWTPPTDGSWIPKARFDEAVQDERSKFTELSSRLDTERTARLALEAQIKEKPKAEPRVYTRIQLRGLVDEGKLSQEQADELMDRQRDAKFKKELDSRFENNSHQSVVADQLAEYVRLAPGIETPGDPQRELVQKEYDYLVGLGDDPNDIATQLKAVRAALGSTEVLKKRASKRQETTQDGSGDTAGGGDAPSTDGAPRGLDARFKTHYERMIDQQQYSGWGDPKLKKELKRVIR